MATIDKDVRKLGKTAEMDKEGNLYAKSVLPLALSDGAVGQTAASADPPTTGVNSGTLYYIATDAAVLALTDHDVGAYGFYQYVVTAEAVDTTTFTSSGFRGLGAAGTGLDLKDGKVGDYIKLFVDNTDWYVVEARGKWRVF